MENLEFRRIMSPKAKNSVTHFSCDFKFIPDFDCAIIQFHGDVRAVDFLSSIEDIEQAPGYDSSHNRLIDYRNASLMFSVVDVAAMTSWAKTKKYTYQHRKVVHIAQNDADFGILRMLMAHSGSFSDNVLVTRSESEALAWIGLNPNASPLAI